MTQAISGILDPISQTVFYGVSRVMALYSILIKCHDYSSDLISPFKSKLVIRIQLT